MMLADRHCICYGCGRFWCPLLWAYCLYRICFFTFRVRYGTGHDFSLARGNVGSAGGQFAVDSVDSGEYLMGSTLGSEDSAYPI